MPLVPDCRSPSPHGAHGPAQAAAITFGNRFHAGPVLVERILLCRRTQDRFPDLGVENILKIFYAQIAFVFDINADPALAGDGADGDIAGVRNAQLPAGAIIQDWTAGFGVPKRLEDTPGISGFT